MSDRGHHNAVQRAHFDATSLENPRMVPARTPYVRRHVERIVNGADLRPGMAILDIGCGQGKFTIPLLERGLDISGLDLSPAGLEALSNHLEGAAPDLYCGDILDPPVELHGRFDAVVGFFVLHHLPDLIEAFRGIHCCLRPGGVAAFLEPNAYSPLFPLQITFTRNMRWRSDKGVFAMRRSKLRAALQTAGFSQVEHRYTGVFPPAVANRGGARLEDRLDRLGIPGPLSSFQVITARAE